MDEESTVRETIKDYLKSNLIVKVEADLRNSNYRKSAYDVVVLLEGEQISITDFEVEHEQ